MVLLPEPTNTTENKIFAWYESQADDGFREHLGASIIGRPCERSIWYSFRWATRASFSGRILRLFQTGQLEEDRIVANLRAIGCEVHCTDPSNGHQQFRVSALGGHFGGSMDAAVLGIPESPKKWHVAEFKTHNEKSFANLVKQSVEKAKPEHYSQMQIYMGLTGMQRALYLAVNKNTDELYVERVKFDQVAFDRLMARAARIIDAAEPLPRISQDPSWFECKFCDHYATCHLTQAPEVNCRTCAHSTPTDDGKWLCETKQENLSVDLQREACSEHRFIPIMLEHVGEMIDAQDNQVKYKNKLTGFEFTNGHAPGFKSREIFAAKDKRILNDADASLLALRKEFDAEITG